MHNIQDFLIETWAFINWTLLPFLFALALLFFLVNVVRYFILGSGEAEGREQARRLALYGIGAFVILVSIWGIVNIITAALGINYGDVPCPDYMEWWCYENDYYGYDEYGYPLPDYPDDPGGAWGQGAGIR